MNKPEQAIIKDLKNLEKADLEDDMQYDEDDDENSHIGIAVSGGKLSKSISK